MMLFCSTHAEFLTATIGCMLLFTYFFLKSAYGETHRRTQILSAIFSAAIVISCSMSAYSEWERHGSILAFCLLGLVVQLNLKETVQTIRRIIAPDEGDAVTVKPTYRQPPAAARTLRFGPHELFVEADRITGRRHYQFVDSIWPLLQLIMLLVVCAVVNHFIGKPLPAWLALFPLAMTAADIVGDLVKWRQIREILSVRDGRLFADETDLGPLRNAKVDVGEVNGDKLVTLITVDRDDPHVLVSTDFITWEDTEGIAKAIRTFLRERQQEQLKLPLS